MQPAEFESREKELLVLAKKLMPRLPFEEIHVLVIDEIGKDISGSGMDTNVVGRKFHAHHPAKNELPKVKRIIIRGLTEATHGNATGIGLAEFCTTRAIEQTDLRSTRINCLTAGHVEGAMLPLDFPTDREAIEVALPTLGLVEPEGTKIVWIRNTLDLSEVECSAACLDEARKRSDLEVLTDLRPGPSTPRATCRPRACEPWPMPAWERSAATMPQRNCRTIVMPRHAVIRQRRTASKLTVAERNRTADAGSGTGLSSTIRLLPLSTPQTLSELSSPPPVE